MPFGLRVVVAIFQKSMNTVFVEIDVVKSYLDNLIISSTNWKDLLRSLQLVLQSIRKANLTLKPKKCVFGAPKLSFLGF